MGRMKTSNRPVWLDSLQGALQPHPGAGAPHDLSAGRGVPERPLRLAILGIGNELNADDGAGVLVARALKARLAPNPQLLVLEAGAAPENFGGPLRRFQPTLVLMIDAVQMDAPPGAITWLAWEQIDGLSASTHTLPPSVFATYLMSELGCRVSLLGIQAACLEMGEPLSAAVQAAVEEVAAALVEALA